jgi:hypothetical protein
MNAKIFILILTCMLLLTSALLVHGRPEKHPRKLEILENKACLFLDVKNSEKNNLYDRSIEIFPINTRKDIALDKIDSLRRAYESTGNKIKIEDMKSRILIRLIVEFHHETCEYMIDLKFSDSGHLSSIRHRTICYEPSHSQGQGHF